MRPPFYVRQLKRDLDDWIARGLVPESSREAILKSVGADGGMSLSAMIAVLGVILIGAAAMSFVGANWEQMSKLVRLIVLFGAMGAAFAGAAMLHAVRPAISGALVLLGVLMFGANIMLIAQTYHINAHYPDGLLLWGAGAIVAAALAPSRASLALALGLGAMWTWQERWDFDQALHLPFLLYWGVCAALAGWLNWRPGVHLAALALIMWLVLSFEGLQVLLGWNDVQMASLYALGPLAIWAANATFKSEAERHALTVEHYAVVAFVAAFWSLHLFGSQTGHAASWTGVAVILGLAAIGAAAYGLRSGAHTAIDVAGVAFFCAATFGFVVGTNDPEVARRFYACIAILIVILWLLSRGVRVEDRFLINLSLIGFGAWVLYAYFVVFGALMDQAVFLGAGGLLLIGLSLVLDRVRRRLTAAPATAQEIKS
jgi:uncharacterized membrane protein